jgi:hypothetical protein
MKIFTVTLEFGDTHSRNKRQETIDICAKNQFECERIAQDMLGQEIGRIIRIIKGSKIIYDSGL